MVTGVQLHPGAGLSFTELENAFPLCLPPTPFLLALWSSFLPWDTQQTCCPSFAGSPAAEQLQDILGEEDEAPNPTLFTEMDTLQHDGDQMEWKESAR